MRQTFVALAIAAGIGLSASVALSPLAFSQEQTTASADQIDYSGFSQLTADLEDYRRTRLVSLEHFKVLAAADDTLILDTRSADAFARGHISGAVNLPFSDFTSESLAQVIGDQSRRILIYCNNNFANDEPPVMLKRAPLALNIPTFINLYGYGYQNIYELGEVVDFNDPAVDWVSG